MMQALSESHEDIAKYRMLNSGKMADKDEADSGSSTPSPSRLGSYVITSEPVLLAFMLGMGLYDPTIRALTYHKICLLEINDTYICDNLHNASFKEQEDIVQTQSSYWFIYMQMCFELPAVFLSFFYGSLGDHVSRRVALLLPCLGQALAMLNYVMCSIYIDSHVGFVLIGQTITGIFGGWITCLLACYSYISEMSTSSRRTLRISVGEGIESTSSAVAMFVSGILLDNTSYTFVFTVAMLLNLLGIVYCLVFVTDPPRQQVHTYTCPEALGEVFQLRRIKDAFMCVIRKRENRGRLRLLLLLTALFFGMVSYYAVYSVAFLFLRRQPLSWTQSRYGIFIGFGRLLSGICSLLVIPLMKHYTSASDTVLLLIGLLSSLASEMFFAFCVLTWMVFLVPVIGVFSQLKYTVFRSLLSQLVEPGELGRMFATLGALQSVTGLVGSSLYNSIYPATLNFWPGFTFTIGATLTVIPVCLTVWMHKDFKTYGLQPPGDIMSDVPVSHRMEMSPLLSDSDSEHAPSSPVKPVEAVTNGHTGYETIKDDQENLSDYEEINTEDLDKLGK